MSDSPQAPPVHTFTIEDLDEENPEQQVTHDQLPNVEEYKSNVALVLQNSTAKAKKTSILVSVIIIFVTLIITSIATGVKRRKGRTSETIYSPTGRLQQIEEFLFSNQISTLPQMREFGSPHHLATAFVADGDILQMQLTPATYKRFVERYILALLYYYFNGPQWTNKLKFLSGLDHCDWHDDFETSNGKDVRQGVVCNDDGFVVELNLCKCDIAL